jgi:hypothetical protein
MSLKELGIDGDYKHLDSTPQGEHRPASVMTLEATVDVKPQALKAVRPFFTMSNNIPSILPPEAQMVLQALFSCFDRQQSVQEGLIGDLLWGFAECGLPPELTLVGLKILNEYGYLKFQAPDNSYISVESEHIGKAWVRYEKKILDMVYVGDK